MQPQPNPNPPWNRARKELRMIILASMENHDEDGELVRARI